MIDQQPQISYRVNSVELSNSLPLVVMGGMNVLESLSLAQEVAEHFIEVTQKLNIPYVFKASFDKANRSSIHSYRGPGLEQGLSWLKDIKTKYGTPIITDVHEAHQVEAAAQVADILQLPAFLCRQTDLVIALAQSGRLINIKKAQFLSPSEMRHIIEKFKEAGSDQVMLCERGTSFGYNNLVVDMLSFPVMKKFGHPIIFDVTHSLQQPGGLAASAGGRREFLTSLALAGVSQGIAGLFLEAHPDPNQAKCDGPCALQLKTLEPFLQQVQAVDNLVKRFQALNTA